MSSVPRDKNLDSTLALLSEGYTFIPNRARRYRSDLFETRLMLRKVICMTGEEAAREFYEPDRFTRKRAMPPTALMLLQDKGSVQLKEGAAHRRRKEMFMSLMTPAGIEQLVDEAAEQWRAYIEKWARAGEVVLHEAAREILCRAVCKWAGVPLTDAGVKRRTHEFGAMIEGAGAVGPRNWWGMLLRARSERWGRGFIRKVRAGEVEVPEGSAAHVIAWHRDLDGELLDTEVAAVELINVLRPTVAVARFVTFSALALHHHPQERQKVQAGGDEYAGWFVQEVRRYYPFFPCIGGRVRNAFEWRGHHFTEGTWVLLDIYGTDHDARIWEEPEAFRPERFGDWDGSAYNFIPQGAGDHYTTHRCAGEWITIALLKVALRSLTEGMTYEVPEQDLRVSMSRMPAIPKSQFVITGVRRAR